MIEHEREIHPGEVDNEVIKIGRDGGLVWYRKVMLEHEVIEYERIENRERAIYKNRRPKVIRNDFEILTPNRNIADLSPKWEEKRLQEINEEKEGTLHEGVLIQITKDENFPDEY